MVTHDIIVIGGSAGSIEALRRIAGGLPADLAAAVLIVVHQPAYAESRLPAVLDRVGSRRTRSRGGFASNHSNRPRRSAARRRCRSGRRPVGLNPPSRRRSRATPPLRRDRAAADAIHG